MGSEQVFKQEIPHARNVSKFRRRRELRCCQGLFSQWPCVWSIIPIKIDLKRTDEIHWSIRRIRRHFETVCFILFILQEKDPFWEPADADVLIGSVHVYLQSLAYKVRNTRSRWQTSKFASLTGFVTIATIIVARYGFLIEK